MTRKTIPHDYFPRERILEWAEKSGGMFDHMAWLNRDLLPVFMRFSFRVAAHERVVERELICAIVYGNCESDNEAERIVKAIREGT